MTTMESGPETGSCQGRKNDNALKVARVVKTGDIGDAGSIPGSGRSPEEGRSTPLQYSCLENPMDGGAWKATVHRIAVGHD